MTVIDYASASTFVVPAGVTSITAECWGGTFGYNGGYIKGDLAVTPGSTVSISFSNNGYALNVQVLTAGGIFVTANGATGYYDDWDMVWIYYQGTVASAGATNVTSAVGGGVGGPKARITYRPAGYTSISATRQMSWDTQFDEGSVKLVGLTGKSTLGATQGVYGQVPTAGNLLLLAVVSNAPVANPSTCATPPGWTAGPTASSTVSSYHGAIFTFWKIAVGSDAAPTLTVVNSPYGFCSVIEEFNGVDVSGNPVDSTAAPRNTDNFASGTAQTTTLGDPVNTVGPLSFVWVAAGIMTTGARVANWGNGFVSRTNHFPLAYAQISTASAADKPPGSYTPSVSLMANGQTAYGCGVAAIAFKVARSVTPVSTTRAASWDTQSNITGTPVSTTRSASWDVQGRILATRVASWNAQARLLAARVASWDVKSQLSAVRTASWDAKSQSSTTRVSSWDTKAPVSTAKVASWDVKDEVAANRVASWVVKSPVSTNLSMSWDTQANAQISTARVVSWNVKDEVSITRVATWEVKDEVLASRTTSWDVASSIYPVSTSRVMSWNTRQLVVTTRQAVWDSRASLAVQRAISWSVLARVSASRVTTWDALTSVAREMQALWDTLAFDQHNIVATARLLPRRWAGLIAAQRNTATLEHRDNEGSLTTRRHSGEVKSRRWKGKLL